VSAAWREIFIQARRASVADFERALQAADKGDDGPFIAHMVGRMERRFGLGYASACWLLVILLAVVLSGCGGPSEGTVKLVESCIQAGGEPIMQGSGDTLFRGCRMPPRPCPCPERFRPGFHLPPEAAEETP
jgi:hypothetical protein